MICNGTWLGILITTGICAVIVSAGVIIASHFYNNALEDVIKIINKWQKNKISWSEEEKDWIISAEDWIKLKQKIKELGK